MVVVAFAFKGFYEKCIIGTQNVSAFTSAHTGETISYTTVKRGKSLEVSLFISLQICVDQLFLSNTLGSVCVYDHRVTIYGCVQPEGLVRMQLFR